MTEGWKCPNCGKAHAPDVKTCPEPASAQPIPYAPPVFPRDGMAAPCPTYYPPVFMDPCPAPSVAPWPFGYPTVTCQAGDPHNAHGGTSYSVPL